MKKTAIYPAHEEGNGLIVPFAGWSLPLHYGSQLNEHLAVRKAAGLFDVSHMTTVDITGPGSKALLEYILANDVDKLKTAGKALYTCMLNENGGILDDLICYHLDETHYRLVVNAATTASDVAWIQLHAKDFDVTVNQRDDLSMVALQGPKTREYLEEMLGADDFAQVNALKIFSAAQLGDLFFARTGYTGEDGFECILPSTQALDFWQKAITAGFTAAGLGARDTLRLEAGLNLYGTDMDETVTPYESNLGWTVSLKNEERNFIGKSALVQQKESGDHAQLLGVVLDGKGVLRAGQSVRVNGQVVGQLTSGSFAPSLQCAIGLARVKTDALPETCEVEIRKKWLPCKIVQPPFIKQGQATF